MFDYSLVNITISFYLTFNYTCSLFLECRCKFRFSIMIIIVMLRIKTLFNIVARPMLLVKRLRLRRDLNDLFVIIFV